MQSAEVSSTIVCDWIGYVLPDQVANVDEFALKCERAIGYDNKKAEKFHDDEILPMVTKMAKEGGLLIKRTPRGTDLSLFSASEDAIKAMIEKESLISTQIGASLFCVGSVIL